jgi:hypothetical protein
MTTADDFALLFQTFIDFQRRQLPPASTPLCCSTASSLLTILNTHSFAGELKGNADEKGAPMRQTLQRAIETLTTCTFAAAAVHCRVNAKLNANDLNRAQTFLTVHGAPS